MQELKIGDTAIAAIPDDLAAELVRAAKASGGRLCGTRGSTVTTEKRVTGLCRMTVPLEVVIEYWPHLPEGAK